MPSNCTGAPPNCQEGKTPLCFDVPGTGIPPTWTCSGSPENYPKDPGNKTCPEGQYWDVSTQKCQRPPGQPPPQQPQGGGGPSPCAGLTGAALWRCRAERNQQSQTETTLVPQTLTDIITRFVTDDFARFVNTGQHGPTIGSSVPEPTGSLLDLILNRTLQNVISGYAGPGISVSTRGRPNTTDGERSGTLQGPGFVSGTPPPVRFLGLEGGAGAYGYIDPAWGFDRAQRTVLNPVVTAITSPPPVPSGPPMNGLVRGGPAAPPVPFVPGGPNPCVGLTGQALWNCRGQRQGGNRPPLAA